MPKTHQNHPKTYEIRIKTTGKVVETTRCWTTAKNLIPKLEKLYDELEIVKVKQNLIFGR